MVGPLRIRDEEPPGDGVVVIRAGILTRQTIMDTATDSLDDYGMYTVSVEGVIGGSVQQTCQESPRIGARYGKVRLSTVGRLRKAGFAVLPTFDPPHFDVILPDLSEVTVARLDRCFDPPIPNPGRPGP